VDPRDPACRQHGGIPSPAQRRRALAAAAAYLRCPVCASPLQLGDSQLACGYQHGFDIARQGYVNLTAGQPGPGTADTSAMVAARELFLCRGHYQPLAAVVQSLAQRHDPGMPGLVADLAGGTGYYLAGLLDTLPHRHGACLDLSVPALRRAARAHPHQLAAQSVHRDS
jgi:23S rRNA (guanine745-N1)-methyltransferase